MSLFVLGDFTSHAGSNLPWKIDCDALTDEDWKGLAVIACEELGTMRFRWVVGVPRGGMALARAILGHVGALVSDAPRLIVDDVLTTGASMREAMHRPDDIGLVVFARGPLPPRVTALFAMPAVHSKRANSP